MARGDLERWSCVWSRVAGGSYRPAPTDSSLHQPLSPCTASGNQTPPVVPGLSPARLPPCLLRVLGSTRMASRNIVLAKLVPAVKTVWAAWLTLLTPGVVSQTDSTKQTSRGLAFLLSLRFYVLNVKPRMEPVFSRMESLRFF